jgi:hypothetical protein
MVEESSTLEGRLTGLESQLSQFDQRLQRVETALPTSKKGKGIRGEFIAAAAGAVAAILLYMQAVDTEARQIASDLLSRFNSKEMWEARLTLERYYYMASGNKNSRDTFIKETTGYYRSLVYEKGPEVSVPKTLSFDNNIEKQRDFFRKVDKSRRLVKNFYEDIVKLTGWRLLPEDPRLTALEARFGKHAGDFLECYWLPVELAQNAALRGNDQVDASDECKTINTFREKFAPGDRICKPENTERPSYCPL